LLRQSIELGLAGRGHVRLPGIEQDRRFVLHVVVAELAEPLRQIGLVAGPCGNLLTN
jgi:hypothetical protein